MLWMAGLVLVWLLLEPSRRYGEHLHDARCRSLESLLRDPILWAFAVLIVFSAVRAVNGNVALSYDFADEKWFISSSYVDFLPGCVKSSRLGLLSGLISVAAGVLACRHGLGGKARAMVVFMTSLFAGLAFLVALFAYRCGYATHEISSLVSYKSASFAGTGFGLFFVASVASFGSMLRYRWNKSLAFFSFACGLSYSGLLYFAPPFVLVEYTLLGILVLAGVFVYGLLACDLLSAFKVLAAFILAAAIPVGMSIALPLHDFSGIKDCIFGSSPFFPEWYHAVKAQLSGIALSAWSESLWQGKGVGAFPLLVKLSEPEASWVACPFNVWSGLLAERGIVGAVLFLSPVCIMAVTYVAKAISASLKKVVWPLAVFGVLNLCAVAVQGFFDSSSFRPEIMTATGIFFAVAASSFPASKSESDVN